MSTPTYHSTAARIIADFVSEDTVLSDRADLARFLREHRLVTEGAIPITLADLDEALVLRAGLRAALTGQGQGQEPEAVARAQRVLDGLRVTVRITPAPGAASPLAPAVVDEVRRGLARIAGAWSALMSTGEWRSMRR
ncbi:MAG TPA: ABATE domain-containing protein [Candidatus Nocardiopsis merdipullorum]|nr:ABATE domain-containing protein [Candidatus Nocardiopsis merdipullorum]